MGHPAGKFCCRTHWPLSTPANHASQVGFGFPQNWQTLAALRFLLGVLEAGFLPCCLFLISTWYTRYDLQKRVTSFYAIGFCASGFGGILAYGLSHMVRPSALSGPSGR